VSHSLSSVEDFCDRVAWLDHGAVQVIGDSSQVVEAYKGSLTGRE
jgi:ABC-type polysaccharide/polyol phosphate transport system ATPase subunit